MYLFEEKPYGCMLTMGGIINQEEMTRFHADALRFLKLTKPGFGMLIDMRNLEPLSHPARQKIADAQKIYFDNGVGRSAVILNSPIVKRQFQDVAKETGVYYQERYIDASATPDWEQVGLDWIEKAIDPETRKKDQSPA